MSKRTRIQRKRLEELEGEFAPLLLACLTACAHGRWGLFGQNDLLDPGGQYGRWPEATRLKQLAQEIRTIRVEIGGTNHACEKFLNLCALRGPNVSGEPKLAAEFLAESGKEHSHPH